MLTPFSLRRHTPSPCRLPAERQHTPAIIQARTPIQLLAVDAYFIYDCAIFAARDTMPLLRLFDVLRYVAACYCRCHAARARRVAICALCARARGAMPRNMPRCASARVIITRLRYRHFRRFDAYATPRLIIDAAIDAVIRRFADYARCQALRHRVRYARYALS